MRILMVSEWGACTYGGVASQVNLLTRWLEERGYDVGVMYKQGYCVDGKHIKVEGILPLDYHVVPPVLWEVKNIIRDVRPDVVHVHHSFTPLSVLAVRACNKLGIPCVLTNHSLPPAGDAEKWVKISYLTPYRWLLRPTVTTAVSTAAALFIKDFLGLEESVKIIPNAVDTEKFKPPEEERDERENYVLYVGRLVRRKGVHVLIRAAGMLEEQGVQCKVLIAGRGYFERYLRLLSADLKNVEFLGEVSERKKAELYRKARVFVLPSLVGESFGVVLLEAFASATPVVATRVGGIPEIVEHGVDGVLVDPGEPSQLAEAIGEMLGSESMWRRMSLNARRKAVEKYSISTVGRLYEQVYLEALERKKSTKKLSYFSSIGSGKILV